jgi:type I restriction enzyme, R subunit
MASSACSGTRRVRQELFDGLLQPEGPAKIPGNWTFVIVTDREDLDGQIYRNFANTGAVLEDEKRVRADSGESLKRMLNQEDHRYVFTLIQKFHTEHGERYPVLSTRRTSSSSPTKPTAASTTSSPANMRSALPNAAFIGFTGNAVDGR